MQRSDVTAQMDGNIFRQGSGGYRLVETSSSGQLSFEEGVTSTAKARAMAYHGDDEHYRRPFFKLKGFVATQEERL